MSGAPRTVACARCGAPATLSLATQAQPCASCRGPLALPPEIRAELASSVALVGDKLVAGRRLDEARVQMLGDEGFALGFAVWLVLIACGGLLTSSAVWAVVDKGFDAAFPGRVVPPLGGVLAGVSLAGAAAWLHRLVRARLQRTFAALPPQRGAPYGACHLCGGPLPAREAGPSGTLATHGSMRCAYCAADNLLGREQVAAIGADLMHGLVAHAADMRSALRTMRATTRLVGVSALLLLPLASFAAAIALSKWLD